MNSVNDFAGVYSPIPLIETEEGRQPANSKRALYPRGVSFQPELRAQNSTAFTGPFTNTLVPAVVPGGPVTLPDVDKMPFYVQQGGGDGTTSLAEIMTYLGKPMTQADIDKAIRRDDTFTAPEDMIEFARDNGLEAEEYNNSTWGQLKDLINDGHPVQALIAGDPTFDGVTGGSAHYVNVTGYGKDPASGEEYVTFHDPAFPAEQRMPASEFQQLWGAVPGGYNNYMQAYGAAGSKLPDGGDAFDSLDKENLQGTQGTLNGLSNILNGWDRWTGDGNELPDFLHGVCQVAGGIPQTVFCGLSAGLQLTTSWLHDQVNGIPVLKNIVQPVMDWVGAAGAGVADVANGFGESMDDFGGALEGFTHGDGWKGLKKLGDAAEDIGSGVAHAVVDTLSDIGHGVADLFGL